MTSKKVFAAPKIPATPSRTINDMLNSKCNHTFDNPAKAGVAYFMAYVFQAINTIYNTINPNYKETPSHTKWMVACGVVSVAIVIKAYLLFHVIMALSVFVHIALYYGSIGYALIGIGIGVSGAMFFDKDGHKPKNLTGIVYQRTQEITKGTYLSGDSAAHTGPQMSQDVKQD